MKLDMHCHVKEGSVDSKVSVDEYITKLKEEGFDVDNVGNDDDDDVSGTDNDDDDDADVDETEGDDEVSGSGSALNKETTSTKALALSLFRDLNGYTTDSDWSNILLTMDSVNSENVLAVLKEFNRRGDKDFWSLGCSAGLLGHDQGFFEWVDREAGHATDRIKVQEEILGEVIKALEKVKYNKNNKEITFEEYENISIYSPRSAGTILCRLHAGGRLHSAGQSEGHAPCHCFGWRGGTDHTRHHQQ